MPPPLPNYNYPLILPDCPCCAYEMGKFSSSSQEACKDGWHLFGPVEPDNPRYVSEDVRAVLADANYAYVRLTDDEDGLRLWHDWRYTHMAAFWEMVYQASRVRRKVPCCPHCQQRLSIAGPPPCCMFCGKALEG